MCSKGELRQQCRDNEATWNGPGVWESTRKVGWSARETVGQCLEVCRVDMGLYGVGIGLFLQAAVQPLYQRHMCEY